MSDTLNPLLVPQPPPQGDGEPVWPLVVADVMDLHDTELGLGRYGRAGPWKQLAQDMVERDHQGRTKYGTPLRAGNGRKPLVDAYQEVLDLCVYLRQAIEEEPEDDAHLYGIYATALNQACALRALLPNPSPAVEQSNPAVQP